VIEVFLFVSGWLACVLDWVARLVVLAGIVRACKKVS
jgi:hypothetical protein